MHLRPIVAAVVMMTLAMPVPGMQQTQDTWWANTATSGAPADPALGEFAVDLGGHAPFSALTGSHYFWSPGFRTFVEDNFLDLPALDSGLNPANEVLPPDYQFVRYFQVGPFWDTSQTLDVWEFRINQGYAQFVRRADKEDDDGDGEIEVMYEHLPSHGKDFGSVGFVPETPFYVPPGLPAKYPWQPAGGNLVPVEQVVKAGDIYCLITENQGGDYWIALQRNQETDWFLRNKLGEFETGSAPSILKKSGNAYTESVGRAFVYGGSFGAGMAQILALLQPNVYAGSANSFSLDYGFEFYGVGDWPRLMDHFHHGIGPPTFVGGEDRNFTATLHSMIDILEIRFDGNGPRSAYDMAAFSALRRPADLLVPMQEGFFGGSDHLVNNHWLRPMKSLNGLYRTWIYKNAVHEGPGVQQTGKNEYFIYDNQEWSRLKMTTYSPMPPNTMFPLGSPAGPVDVIGGSAYPAPYGHTLRHSCQGVRGPALLTEIDLIDTDLSDTVTALGQGVGLARGDALAVGDFDGDGRKEAVFGNFDGYIHVVELPELPTTLVDLLKDEWKSQRLGWGLWSVARLGNTLTFGNQQGQLFELAPGGPPDSYTVSTKVASLPAQLYDGAVRMVFRGNFDSQFAGTEYLILNHHKDWVFLRENGLHDLTLRRENKAVGPGRGTVVSGLPGGVDTDPEDELIIPALDGHVWVINENGATPPQLIMDELIPYGASGTPRAWSRAVAVDPNEDGTPEQLLLFGRNDSLPVGQTERIMLYDFAAAAFVAEAVTQVPLAGDPGFTWIVRPTASGTATFAVGAGNVIETFSLTATLIGNQTVTALPIDLQPDEVDMVPRGGVTALASFTMPTEPVTRHLIATSGNGRIWILDDQLAWVRDSLDEDPTLTTGTELPWPSNRTMAWEYAADAEQTGNAAVQLYVANYQQRFQDLGAGNDLYRIEGLALDAANNVTFTPDYTAWPLVPSFTEDAPNRHKGDLRAPLNRFLRYGGSGTTAYTAAEAGALYEDPDPMVGTRTFCNLAVDSGLRTGVLGGAAPLGGYLFEMLDGPNNDYAVFSGFVTTPESAYYVSQDTNDWFYPLVTMNRPGKVASGQSPQLDSQLQSTLGGGTSMVIANLWGGDPGQPGPLVKVPCVVTGTMGGYAYAAQIPSQGNLSGEEIPVPPFSGGGAVFYESVDLGWNVIGMDAGELDEDPSSIDEIVVGTLVDGGTYDDWESGTITKHRSQLTILRANPTNKKLEIDVQLNASDLGGPDEWITSGVFGVKIDNVDDAGPPEIWCGDGAGHLYLFQKIAGTWTTVYKTDCLSPYMGAYNRIYPVKASIDQEGEPAGVTIKLVVMSAGYVHAFDVNAGVLGQGQAP